MIRFTKCLEVMFSNTVSIGIASTNFVSTRCSGSMSVFPFFVETKKFPLDQVLRQVRHRKKNQKNSRKVRKKTENGNPSVKKEPFS